MDQLECAVIGAFQLDQHNPMLKVLLKNSTQDHISSQKEGVFGKNISILSHCMELGHFMLHFTTFHDVSIYVK